MNNKIENTCCFTGNRPKYLPWGENEFNPECGRIKENLYALLEDLYKDGYRFFICGMAIGADMYFSEAVLELKDKFNDVSLECAYPCKGSTGLWSIKDKLRASKIEKRADTVTFLSDKYYNGCMQKRNRYMVDKASILITLRYTTTGGTAFTADYAEKKNKKILDLVK